MAGTAEESGGTVRYSVPEAARLLGISERAVRKRIDVGTMRAEREGRNWIVLVDRSFVSADSGGTAAVPESEPVERNTVIDAERQAQADVVIQRMLAPFIAELGTVREELGAARNELQHERERREEAERTRDELMARFDASKMESPPSETQTPQRGVQREIDPSARDEGEKSPKRRSWLARFFSGE